MPLVYGAAESRASYKILDFNAQEKPFQLTAKDEATVKAGLDLLNKITGVAIEELHVTSSAPVTSGANTPAFGHQREYVGVFQCILDDGTLGEHVFPAPIETALLTSDKKFLNLAQTDVAAYVTWLTTPANGVKVKGKQVTGIKQAFVRHNKSSTKTEKLTIG